MNLFSPKPHFFGIRWDKEIGRVTILTMTPETLEWLKHDPKAQLVIRVLEEEWKGLRVRDDPEDWEAPPPAGVLYPKLLAAQMQTRLREAFADEPFSIYVLPWKHMEQYASLIKPGGIIA